MRCRHVLYVNDTITILTNKVNPFYELSKRYLCAIAKGTVIFLTLQVAVNYPTMRQAAVSCVDPKRENSFRL